MSLAVISQHHIESKIILYLSGYIHESFKGYKENHIKQVITIKTENEIGELVQGKF